MIPPPLLILLASWFLRVWSAIARPSSVTCARGWYIEGVRPSGESRCVQAPAPDGTSERDVQPLPVRVWCSSGEHALVISERTAACVKGTRA